MCKFPKIVSWHLGTNGKKIQHVLTPDEEDFMRDEIGAHNYYQGLINSRDNVNQGFFLRPCGKCEDCRFDEARDWTNRIVCESLMYKPGLCWFVTFTYDDDSLVYSTVNKRTGELLESFVPTLHPPHVDTLIDSLRKHFERNEEYTGIRFYFCGEYGTKSFRPHYHFCFFNLPFELGKDLKYYKTNYEGDILYNCDWLEKIWNKGYVVVAELNVKTASYVARYCLKKQFSTDEFLSVYDQYNVHPVFSGMSTHPGLGFSFFEKYVDKIYSDDYVQLPNGARVTPPRYFDKLYEKINPDHLHSLKMTRLLNGAITTDFKLSKTDLDEYHFFLSQSDTRSRKRKALIRTL